ncbi:MAG: hypothetical protein MJZ29_10155 [Bacteroidaceae bacterium]|nr:hypothetical protein [Bacteroidaceae bacterium]
MKRRYIKPEIVSHTVRCLCLQAVSIPSQRPISESAQKDIDKETGEDLDDVWGM